MIKCGDKKRMELNQINQEVQKISKEQQEAVLKLIDIKTNNDMKEVIQSIKHLENSFESRLVAIDTRFTVIFWALGIIITLIIAIVLRLVVFP